MKSAEVMCSMTSTLLCLVLCLVLIVLLGPMAYITHDPLRNTPLKANSSPQIIHIKSLSVRFVLAQRCLHTGTDVNEE